MGQSTNAILAYGVDFGEDVPFSEEYLKTLDLSPADDGETIIEAIFEHDFKIPPYGDPGRPDYSEISKLENLMPVELIRHCALECPMYVLAVRGAHTEASRGYPQVIEPAALTVDPYAIAAFKVWCQQHGVSLETEPKWLLMSDWT